MIKTGIVDIVCRASSGDAEAFDTLCEQKTKGVFLYAKWMLNNNEDAEDAVQDTFLDMFQGIKGLRDPMAINPWIRNILRNNCNRQLLKRRSMDTSGKAYEEALETAEEPERSMIPETAAIDNEGRKQLLDAIFSLNYHHCRIVSMYYFSGMSCAQIGQKTGKTARVTASDLHRARQKIRSILESENR
ncbi:sigma-24 (FecI-like protein) [Clostridia bacterium]|nr:sigma-24 (FecI-like protein) [Clostridia bacterium]